MTRRAPGAGMRAATALALLALLGLLGLLGACQRDGDGAARPPAESTAAATAPVAASSPMATEAPAPAASAAVQSDWQCGDQRVAARFDPLARTVTVTHDRGQLVLSQAQSASGARYADANGNEFWTKGASGTLTLSGTPPRECGEVATGG